MHHTMPKKEKSSLPKIGCARGPLRYFGSDPHLGVDGPQDFGCARAEEMTEAGRELSDPAGVAASAIRRM